MIPIEFLRQFRFEGYAIFDFLAAFLGVYLLSSLLSRMFRKIGIEIPKKNWLFLTLPIGIMTHLIVGKITPMTRDFTDFHGYYILKIVIVILFVLGMRGIKFKKQNFNG